MDDRYIVIFDGVCNFCNGAVNFIIARDPEGKFAFAPIQTQLAQELVSQCGIEQGGDAGVDTLVLLKKGQCYVRTDAVLEIARDLKGPWWLFNAFRVLPRGLRDYFYRVFARYRYRLFGKRKKCMIPSRKVRDRFLDACR